MLSPVSSAEGFELEILLNREEVKLTRIPYSLKDTLDIVRRFNPLLEGVRLSAGWHDVNTFGQADLGDGIKLARPLLRKEVQK